MLGQDPPTYARRGPHVGLILSFVAVYRRDGFWNVAVSGERLSGERTEPSAEKTTISGAFLTVAVDAPVQVITVVLGVSWNLPAQYYIEFF